MNSCACLVGGREPWQRRPWWVVESYFAHGTDTLRVRGRQVEGSGAYSGVMHVGSWVRLLLFRGDTGIGEVCAARCCVCVLRGWVRQGVGLGVGTECGEWDAGVGIGVAAGVVGENGSDCAAWKVSVRHQPYFSFNLFFQGL